MKGRGRSWHIPVARTMVEEARKNEKGSAYARLRQLDTLLLEVHDFLSKRIGDG